jgi:hypothetical protein
LAFTTS